MPPMRKKKSFGLTDIRKCFSGLLPKRSDPDINNIKTEDSPKQRRSSTSDDESSTKKRKEDSSSTDISPKHKRQYKKRKGSKHGNKSTKAKASKISKEENCKRPSISSEDETGYLTPPEDNTTSNAPEKDDKFSHRVSKSSSTACSQRSITQYLGTQSRSPDGTCIVFNRNINMEFDAYQKAVERAYETQTVTIHRISPEKECERLGITYGGEVRNQCIDVSDDGNSEEESDNEHDDDDDDEGEYRRGKKRHSMKEVKKKSQDYEVEKVLAVRFKGTGRGRHREFLVKWRWWDDSHNSWQKDSDMTGCQLLVFEFHSVNEHTHLRKRYEKLLQFRNSLEEMMDKDFDDFGLLVKFFGDCVQWTAFSRGKLKAYKKRISTEFAYLWDYGNNFKHLITNLLPRAINDAKLVKGFITRPLEDDERSQITSKTITPLQTEALEAFLEFYEARWEVQEKIKDYADFINNRQKETFPDAPPIVVQNYVDMDVLTKEVLDFQPFRVPGEGIEIPSEPAAYCSCGPDGVCDSETCNCFQESNGGKLCYDEKGLLKRGKFYDSNVVYECNKKCSCYESCLNRVTEKHSQVKLAIFKTKNGRGWGVKALEKIPRGTFVFEYTGEVITEEQASDRGQVAQIEKQDYNYFFDLDMAGPNEYVVDAAVIGNISHFVNHSCDPNLESMNVLRDCQDTKLPQIMFFAAREIRALEELTFDYKMHIEKQEQEDSGLEEDASTSTPRDSSPAPADAVNSTSYPANTDPDIPAHILHEIIVKRFSPPIKRIKCKCGAKICRGYLF